MKAKYDWLLFDLDNTLLDFDATSEIALRSAFAQHSIDYTQENIQAYEKINRDCWEAFERGEMDFVTLRNIRFEHFVKQRNLNIDPMSFGNTYMSLLSSTDHKIDGAIELLKALKGKFNLAIVTNGLKEVKIPQLAKPDISQFFNQIFISEVLGVSKPHHGFFQQVFEKIGHPQKDKVAIVGDSLSSDIKGGYDYGIDTIWFNPKQKTNLFGIKPTWEIQNLNSLNTILKD